MTGIKVTSTLGDLAADLRTIATEAEPTMDRELEKKVYEGRDLARVFATASSGKHGPHYPNAITAERTGRMRWEYGPDASMPQGNMSWEYGSRNQPPHLDLNRSADVIAPRLGEAVLNAVDGLFWPGK